MDNIGHVFLQICEGKFEKWLNFHQPDWALVLQASSRFSQAWAQVEEKVYRQFIRWYQKNTSSWGKYSMDTLSYLHTFHPHHLRLLE
jgi:hypothetical protein